MDWSWIITLGRLGGFKRKWGVTKNIGDMVVKISVVNCTRVKLIVLFICWRSKQTERGRLRGGVGGKLERHHHCGLVYIAG